MKYLRSFFILLVLTSIPITGYNQDLESDSLALVAFYDAMDGPDDWDDNSGWLVDSLKNWHGVTVENGRVKKLILNKNGLHGSLPDELIGLNALTHLNLGDNSIYGNMDPVWEIPSLTNLDLSNSGFNGPLSPKIRNLINLEYLDLSNCRLNGTIPREIEVLERMIEIDLSSNMFCGAVPEEVEKIGNSSSSITLNIDISDNQLIDIPNDLKFERFTVFDAVGNFLGIDDLELEPSNYATYLQRIDLPSSYFRFRGEKLIVSPGTPDNGIRHLWTGPDGYFGDNDSLIINSVNGQHAGRYDYIAYREEGNSSPPLFIYTFQLDVYECAPEEIIIRTPVVLYDDDNDGYGNRIFSLVNLINMCRYIQLDPGFTYNSGDCDDTDPNIIFGPNWYRDDDGDGYGDRDPTDKECNSNIKSSCLQPEGYVSNNLDCDDQDPDSNIKRYWYKDQDNDGYGTPMDSVLRCYQLAGFASNKNDCDDQDASINPENIWFRDEDSDGYGDPLESLQQCTQPDGYVSNDLDCDDTDELIWECITGLDPEETSLSVYPNPCPSPCTMTYPERFDQLTIVDATGRIHRTFEYQEFEQYQLEGLGSGIYILLIDKDEKREYELLIVE